MRYKRTARFFILFAVLLSNAMCVMVTYNYCTLQWGGRYAGWSAPPDMAFIYAIPFLICILICFALASFCRRKDQALRRQTDYRDWNEIFQRAKPLVEEYLIARPRPDELEFVQSMCEACQIGWVDALWVIREIRRGKRRGE